MPLFELVSLVLLIALAWLWLDSVRARDLAIREAKLVCAAEGLQFLDETVAIASLRPARNDDGQLALRRVYAFEYSDTGNNRRPGSIVLLGQDVLFINVGLRLASELPTLH